MHFFGTYLTIDLPQVRWPKEFVCTFYLVIHGSNPEHNCSLFTTDPLLFLAVNLIIGVSQFRVSMTEVTFYITQGAQFLKGIFPTNLLLYYN